jgi:hypothetical protein
MLRNRPAGVAVREVAGLRDHVREGAVAVVAEERVALGVAGGAEARDEDVEVEVAVVVAHGEGAPPVERDTEPGGDGDVAEEPAALVAQQNGAGIDDVGVSVAVVVERVHLRGARS